MNVRYRQLRGLVYHYRRRSESRLEYERKWGYSRSLVGGVVPRTIGEKYDGRCRWCRFRVPPNKRTWCGPGCLRAYAMAQGLQKAADGQYILSTHNARCARCGRGGQWYGPPDSESRWNYYDLEVDHIVALSVAFYRGERARMRAYTIDNLQWLCPRCHAEKTADDKRRYLNLAAGRAEDWKPSFGDPRRSVAIRPALPLPLFENAAAKLSPLDQG